MSGTLTRYQPASRFWPFLGDEYSAKTSHLYRPSGSRATVIGATGYAAIVGVPRFVARAR